MTEDAIEIVDLSIRYGRTLAIEGVNISLKKNNISAFVGPSGAGKTSILKSLNRMTDLEKECKVEGRIEVEGFGNIVNPNTDLVALRRAVGMIFQKPNPFPLSIRKNFALPLRERGVKKKLEIDHLMEGALKRVGLWKEVSDRLDHRANNLSGGQQQRLCIARALVLDPKVLLFDEPCSALDPMATKVIEDLILELREQISVVIVTHNLAQAKRIADDLAVFWCEGDGGRVVEFGKAKQVFEAPCSSFAARYLSGERG